MSACPGESTLRLLGTDALGDETYAAIEQHVEGCPACKAILERLAHRRSESAFALPDPERWPRIPGFEIQSELGRGSMGVVYLAIETDLDRPVALKILPGALGLEAGIGPRRRWLREARAVSSVRHSNIVPLYDFGEADGWFFLVLEYVPGGTLKQRLTEPLTPRVAAGLVGTIARAIGHVHSCGLHHFDLKPSNILLDSEGKGAWDRVTPRITDFGLAVFKDDVDGSEKSLAGLRGTPSYMAPEQATASHPEVGAAADIYALGAILYELLTGRPPFQGTSTLQTLDQVRTLEPVPLRQLNLAIPRDIETICLTCLQKDPKQRYSSAKALGEDLVRFLEGKPISARPVSPLEKTWRWCRRQPVIAALTAALTLVLSIGFLIIVLLWRHAEAERRRAEDDLQFAGLMLNELSQFSLPGSEQSVVLTRNDVIAVLQRTRNYILEMRKQRPDSLTTYYQLAQLDICLATHFELQEKSEERRASLIECLENVERAIQIHPQNLTAMQWRFIAYGMLGSVAEKQGKIEESLGHLERSVAHGEECLRLNSVSPDLVTKLAECRLSLAQSLSRQGNDEKAKSLILANRRMLDDFPEDDRTPIVTIWRTLVRLDLHEFKVGSTTAPGSRLDEGAPLSRLATSDADRLDAESWASLVARCLSTGPSAIDLTSNHLCMLVNLLSERMAWQRRLGRIEAARRAGERMHALGRLLVARYPDQPVAHLALCTSLQQMAKNAWKTDDRTAVERNWKLAIEEARRALSLDPHNARAEFEAADLQKRLDLLLASTPASRN